MDRAYRTLASLAPLLLLCAVPLAAQQARVAPEVHVWERQEITLTAAGEYADPYTDVTAWVDLKGPTFSRRIHAFGDGGRVFRVRVVATEPGEWSWTSGSNQPGDGGLNGRSGRFTAMGPDPTPML